MAATDSFDEAVSPTLEGVLPVSDPPVSATTGAGTGGRSLVELLEEVTAGVISVPVDGAGPVDPSANPEEDVISGVAGSAVGVLPLSDPPVVVTTGVGVPGSSLVEPPEELAGAMSVPVDGAVRLTRLPIQKRM